MSSYLFYINAFSRGTKKAREKDRILLLNNKQQLHKEIPVSPWFLLAHKAGEITEQT